MLYMVEMDMPERSRLGEWHEWYLAHIRKLLTAEGYYASQRFEVLGPRAAPFLAIHDVVGPELFSDAQYQRVGGPSGTGEWQQIMTNWSRNLFDGCERLPEIGGDQCLALVDDRAALPAAFTDRVVWLTNAGLDRSVAERGLIILDGGEDAGALAAADGIDLFTPITGKLR